VELDPLFLSRLQFALTIGFHFLFPPLTIGLAWLLVLVEWLGWRRSDEDYVRAGGFFGKILGLYLFGRGKVSKAVHWSAVFNPSTIPRFSHTMSATIIAGALLMAGISAYLLLRDKETAVARKTLKIGLIVGLIASLAALFPTGHHHAQQVARTQPKKRSAMEGLIHGQDGAPLTLIGIPSEDPPELNYAIGVPGLLSWMAFGDADAHVDGIEDLRQQGHVTPPFAITFISFHLMVGLGSLFIALTGLGVLMLAMRRIDNSRLSGLFLRSLIWTIPLPLAACQLGWIVAEVGRQPWVVYRLLKTSEAFAYGPVEHRSRRQPDNLQRLLHAAHADGDVDRRTGWHAVGDCIHCVYLQGIHGKGGARRAVVLALGKPMFQFHFYPPRKERIAMSRNLYSWLIGFWLLAPVLALVQTGCQPTDSSSESPAPGDAQAEPVSNTAADGEQSGVPLGLPALPVPDENPQTPEKIALGKMLYFDKRLSKDGTISCATCHDPEMAWTEHRATSKGIGDQVGGANSPTVINAAYAKKQFWDGRADTLEDQALGPIENPIEMGHDLDVLVKELAEIPEYKEGFQKVFGTEVTKDGIAKAIASFERTVLSGNSPYDRFETDDKDALTESQKRGMELFDELSCSTCHAPPLFSNYGYYNAGVGMDKEKPDEGRKAVTGKDRDLGKFRVPSLREVANTGPYYHDGSVETLEEAVAIMAGGGKDDPKVSAMLKGLRDEDVSEQDKKDLVEFLKALSGEFPGKDDI